MMMRGVFAIELNATPKETPVDVMLTPTIIQSPVEGDVVVVKEG